MLNETSDDYHQMYRGTTLGNTLQESLEEMLEHKLLKKEMVVKILQKFDQCICTALSTQIKSRLNLQGYLNAYRNCDNVWTLVLNNVEIKDGPNTMHVEKMKIVACEGKHSKSAGGQGGPKGASGTARMGPGFPAAGNTSEGDLAIIDDDRSDDELP